MPAAQSLTSKDRHRLVVPSRHEMTRRPLSTDRAILEPVSSVHAMGFFRAVDEARSALQPWLPWVPLNDSPESSLRYTNACERDWDKGAAVRFFVRVRNTPGIAGVVSLENCVQTHLSCDLGYWLHPAHQGKGLMTEAAGHIVDFAFDQMNAHRIRAAAAEDNLASQRVIEHLHFKREGIARDAEYVDGRWVNHIVYARLRYDPPRRA